jgi:hypothetical protein
MSSLNGAISIFPEMARELYKKLIAHLIGDEKKNKARSSMGVQFCTAGREGNGWHTPARGGPRIWIMSIQILK